MINITKYNFKEGDVLICIISANSYLVLGNTYVAERVIGTEEIMITNENGYRSYYNKNRFISKSELRDFSINKIIE